jgi:ABC-type iron transport system FetAB ATPase subunit
VKGIFNIALDCDIALPELPEIESAERIIKISAGSPVENNFDGAIWFHDWCDPDDEICISCAKLGDLYLLRFPEQADFIISISEMAVHYFPKNNLGFEILRHLLIDQVVPRILGHLGELILHASAISMPNGCSIAFIGESGQGKSTLAASFYQNGSSLLTDDCLLVSAEQGQIFGIPNYHGVRLYDDSAIAIFDHSIENKLPVAHDSDKSRLLLPAQTRGAIINRKKLSAFFFLADSVEGKAGNEVNINPIRGADEMISLINQTFILDVTNKELIKNQFLAIRQLFDCNVQMFRLSYPKQYSLLPELHAKIEAIIAM